MNENLKPSTELVSLKGRKALITGAAVGIGRAIALRFAEAGAELELVDINKEGLRRVRRECSQLGIEAGQHMVDVSRKDEIAALWETLEGNEPDILVNNAGIYPMKRFVELDEDFLGKVMDINLNSALWMCYEMIKRRARRGGVIINIGSIEAILPLEKDLVHYSISKAGILALTRGLAKDYGKQGFRINAILPGGIVTPGTKAVAKELAKFKVGLLKSGFEFSLRLPLGRSGQPDEVARIALVLASDLSSYVHGALIPVDGGFLSS